MRRKTKLLTIAFSLAIAAPLQAQSAGSTTTYAYDALGRLIDVQVSSASQGDAQRTYQYDKAGNRTQVSATGDDSDDGGGEGEVPDVATLRVTFNGIFIISRKK